VESLLGEGIVLEGMDDCERFLVIDVMVDLCWGMLA
jgi:hypothetical protein